MPNNENNFTLDGVEYVAVDGVAICLDCALKSINCDVDGIPNCIARYRTDGREVIFKKVLNDE